MNLSLPPPPGLPNPPPPGTQHCSFPAYLEKTVLTCRVFAISRFWTAHVPPHGSSSTSPYGFETTRPHSLPLAGSSSHGRARCYSPHWLIGSSHLGFVKAFAFEHKWSVMSSEGGVWCFAVTKHPAGWLVDGRLCLLAMGHVWWLIWVLFDTAGDLTHYFLTTMNMFSFSVWLQTLASWCFDKSVHHTDLNTYHTHFSLNMLNNLFRVRCLCNNYFMSVWKTKHDVWLARDWVSFHFLELSLRFFN